MRPLILILSILLLPLLVLSFITAGTASVQKDAAAQFVRNKKIKSQLTDTVKLNPGKRSADVINQKREEEKILVELNKTPH